MRTSTTLRVLLLEDDPLDAEQVVESISRSHPGSEVRWVSCASDFQSALETFGPDVILSDHAVGSFTSVDALRLARQQRAGLPVIVVSGFFESTASDTLRCGAADFVRKADLSRLGPAISLALDRRALLQRLSERQREVLGLLAAGRSMREIAEQLGLSVKTVETHRAEVARRLGIRDLAGLVRYAIRVGMISASE